MAFEYERYLKSYETANAEFYQNRSCVSQPGNISDEIPGGTTFSPLSNEEPYASTPPVKSQHLRDLDRLLGSSFPSRADSNGVDILESRFRSSQGDESGKPPGRGKRGFFKQTSLPASLGGSCGSKTWQEISGRRRRNSVRFADEVGENLTTFVLIPSRFEDKESKTAHDASILSSDTQDNSSNCDRIATKDVSTDAKTNGACAKRETPSFQLCFDQPAANFDEFRRRLHFQFVCLENVKVDVKSQADGTMNGFVNHGTVLCTIKVRNLYPMKRVFARCTDNSWVTYADVPAVYVGDGTSGYNDNDTFTFALRNPLRYQSTRSKGAQEESYCRKTASVEFAICYEVLGSTYWDNNSGQNYRIVWM